ncbi:MAG TPA: hypothetical protein VJS12_13355 [Steroidobacteraceae bacterium]|nr:hypothetical protein [Steroidobacteraceae bacterium]
MVRVSWVSVVLVAVLGAPLASHAAGTPAGTNIQNTAQVSYTVGGSAVTTSSNTTSVRVAEILDAVLTLAAPTVTVSPGATAEELVYTLTNTGNGSETFNLTALSAGVTGDDFDPTLATPAIYFDTDNSGDFSGGDVAFSPGVNNPVLAADASVRLIVVNNIPNTVLNGNRGRGQLTAAAATGTGAPGTAFVGAGDGGVDAVAGTTGGDALLFGEYLVADVQLTAVKSQTIVDQFGGARPLPGARINYQVVVTASGAGNANAAVFSDLVPANTSFVAGSLRLNGAALSDGADADAGTFVSTPAPEVRVTLGNLTGGSGPQTIEFAVTIH